MKCVILQPSYIPWRGYFHQIWKADLFIFYDDAQYDKNGWRNRNRIKTSQGLQWLTIPVHTKGSVLESTPINGIKISWEKPWNLHHWRGIQFAYRKAPFFSKYNEYFSDVFNRKPEFLSAFTIQTTIELARLLGIDHTKFLRSSEIDSVEGERTDRLISILKKVGADHYISGPSARDYIEQDKFDAAGITLEYMTYNYPDYDQLYPPFEMQVSVIDLLFMKGENSLNYIR
ncbi:MAG: WbqC family protein [Anaerolineaceae bacterium]|nr:WbqC family protein [Anaerolineaceae bacterium]